MNIRMFVTAFVLSVVMVVFTGFGSAEAAPIVVDFELEIELKDNTKYDIEYEVKNEGFEAKYEAPGSATVYGQDAKTKLDPLLDQLQLTPSMNKTKLKNKILTIFKLTKTDISDFELEVTFDNGKKLKIDN